MLRMILATSLLLAFLSPAHAGDRQMVASAHPLASAAGKEMLDAGGNAVDAAVAVQMVLSVVEPHASGIGGGALMLLWEPGAADPLFFDGLAIQPARATAALTVDVDGSRLPIDKVRFSGRAAIVPGAVAMEAMVHGAHGRLPWARLFEPAIRAAEDGFPMPSYLHHALTTQGRRVRDPALRAEWFDAEGGPRAVGTPVRNLAQAAALRRLAAEGPSALYRGELARAIAAAVAADDVPGFVTEDDLAAYRPVQRAPLCAVVLMRRLCSAPPPSYGGIAVIQILTIAATNGILAQVPGSAAAAHLFLEASRLAFADRLVHVGDPDVVSVPTAGLVDGGYLARRARLVRPDASMGKAEAGEPPGRRADAAPSLPWDETGTSHVAIADREGRVVSMTTTIGNYFGSGIAVAGFYLNGAATNFATLAERDGKPTVNRMAPDKRPYTSMAPSILFDDDGRPAIAVGAAGAAYIPSYVALATLGLVAWGDDPAAALARPHWHNANGASELEAGTEAVALIEPLRALGHEARTSRMQSGLAAIKRDATGWTGAADPRRDGAAVGD
ncbi:MAG: gamma-glutamyltransferase family protein [Alphaproteobacteria bacterium]|nr:gamma-glutamyltransferase family protein [Alphaproteobacteria bacterium]